MLLIDELHFQMRQEMVNHKESETEFSVLQHLDNMKRISIRTLRYFYGPIEGTPFSLALALPEKYGMHELYAQQEIRHSQTNGKDGKAAKKTIKLIHFLLFSH